VTTPDPSRSEAATCATCKWLVGYIHNERYVACSNVTVPVQIFTPQKAAEWGCILHEHPARQRPQETP
jgi:hypothetical protein